MSANNTTPPLPILDENRQTESLVSWIQSLKIVLPKLSAMALQSAAFDHYDKSIQPGEPTAAALAAGIMNLPDLDQKTAAARRSEWSRSRCVEYLRFQAAVLNKELVEIAEKTKSEAVKVAVIDAIYFAIISAYPHLKAEAADMAVRKKLELVKNGKRSAAVTSHKLPEPVAPIIAPEPPKTTLAGVADVETVQKQATQVANLILLCIREVADYVVPQAQSAGVTLDAQSQHALTMNMIITLSSGSKSHWKMPTERKQK